MHSHRIFDPDKNVRLIADKLYESIRELPLICPHGHVDPQLFARNIPFENPTDLLIRPDHYILRLLYSRGIRLAELGIASKDAAADVDPARVWQIFADNYFLFHGTPTGVWLSYVFSEIFNIPEPLNQHNAMVFYDHLNAELRKPEFLPRALYNRFNIEVLTTTDAATDSLSAHTAIRSSKWNGKVIPCFRPDQIIKTYTPGWGNAVQRLGEMVGWKINSYQSYIKAIEERRKYFKRMGAVSTDHDVMIPYTARLQESVAEKIFQRALHSKANENDTAAFEAHMLMEMARMSVDDGLVMQIHPGIYRNHNNMLYKEFGPDMGGDIPVQVEFTRNLHNLLNAYGNDQSFQLVVFTLDESTYTRELAPMAGHYPALKLGPAWWFNDSIEGMTRYRKMVTESSSIYNTAGFNDDTRALLSIPARHDLCRRIDCNWLAQQVARHIIDMDAAQHMAYELTNGLVKKTYNL